MPKKGKWIYHLSISPMPHRRSQPAKRRHPASPFSSPAAADETIVYGWRAVAAGIQADSAQNIFYNPATRHPQTLALIQKLPAQKISHKPISRAELARLCGSERHQDIAAIIRIPQTTLAKLLASDKSLLVLDGVTDSRNLGAIMRSARAFDCGGVIVPTRNSAPLNAVAAKTAAGAVAFLPVLRVVNIARTLTAMKDSERTVIGMSETAEQSLWTATLPPPASTCWVLGDEGDGLRALTRRHCDLLLRIPATAGEAGCLNVAMATTICLAAAYSHSHS